MSKLYVLVGLPASGKSTWAKNNINSKTKWISSDNLRRELFGSETNQDNNDLVFKEMKNRTKVLLDQGFDVIYDATNIVSKRRKTLISDFKKHEKICVYFATDKLNCIFNNNLRDRNVPEEIINKMFKTLQIPMFHEGWDNIKIIRCKLTNDNTINININDYINDYQTYIDVLLYTNPHFRNCIEMPQDNPYHTLSVTRHMYEAFKYLKNNNADNNLLLASLFHDVGKGICKNFKEGSRYANFVGHENVSAQLVLNYLYDFGFDLNDILDICKLIQLHMRFMNLKDNYKGKEKLLKLIGEKDFNRLLKLYNADKQAK